MNVKITVVYPVSFEINLTKEELKDRLKVKEELLDIADYLFESCGIKPVISESSVPELID